jgi:hypothetical protein
MLNLSCLYSNIVFDLPLYWKHYNIMIRVMKYQYFKNFIAGMTNAKQLFNDVYSAMKRKDTAYFLVLIHAPNSNSYSAPSPPH